MERNRRIAKAYSRVPVLSIAGTDDGFDGYKIGLNGFDNPMRDALTKTVKRHIGKGVRLKMDDMGNIIIKRMSNCDVFIRGWDKEANSLSDDIIELSGELEYDKSVKLFDMKKFQASISRELRSAYPDRRKLENQCICAIAFVKDSTDILDLCSWVLLINIVALDLIKSRFPAMGNFNRMPPTRDLALASPQPPSSSHPHKTPPKFVSIFEQQQQQQMNHHHHSQQPPGGQQQQQQQPSNRSSSDEDPYSLPSIPSLSPAAHVGGRPVANNGDTKSSSNGSGKSGGKNDPKPPELPPRDFVKNKKSKSRHFPIPFKSWVGKSSKSATAQQQAKAAAKQNSDKKKEIEYEDPYYCGLQARVPNFTGNAANGGGGRQRKSIAGPVTGGSGGQAIVTNYGILPNGQHREDMRKSQSNGYLNSLFNQSSNYNPKGMNLRGSSNYSFYDSSLESSDVYGISSGSGYDIYAPINGPIYGQLRARLPYDQVDHGRHGNGRHIDDRKIEPFSYTARYASDWD
ncbi:hypothetical protein HDE_08387 [Halotydeus destructor]|nr:hypothetical protein HDE_08387 [Halotydeus destructor]